MQCSVPSDLYDYLEKMDKDEEEAEELVAIHNIIVTPSLLSCI